MVTTDHARPVTAPSAWADATASSGGAARVRHALPLLLWAACLGLAIALLLSLGSGRLAAPSLTDPASWPAWAAARDPLEVVMVVLRIAALAGAWYLAGVTSVSVVARAFRAARLVRLADALSVGPVRVLVQQALGVGLAAGVVVSSVPGPAAGAGGRAAASAPRPDVAVMSVVSDEAAEEPADTRDGTGSPPELAPAGPLVMAPMPAMQHAGEGWPAPAATGSEVSTGREVSVAPGDHFWSLAERAVADHHGRAGTEQEVGAYWQALVQANADRLVVAGNPDLLVPGQTVVVPDVSTVTR